MSAFGEQAKEFAEPLIAFNSEKETRPLIGWLAGIPGHYLDLAVPVKLHRRRHTTVGRQLNVVDLGRRAWLSS
jgi:hypothetical protein